MVLCSYVNYNDQSLSTFFKKCIFESVLNDVNYEYLLIMLCEIIDRIGFDVGGIFENFKIFFGIFLFKKLYNFWVWWLFFGVWAEICWCEFTWVKFAISVLLGLCFLLYFRF